jgi:energy-coupling factor transporter ATP-binding protein EcfA2
MSGVQIENVGAIQSLAFDVPADGGVVLIKGPNGAGKSTALAAVAAASRGGKATGLTPHGACPKGTVEAFGVKMTVGRTTTRSGSLEVLAVDAAAEPAAIVDPGIKDPERADAARIKSLLSVIGAEPDVSAFDAIIPAASRADVDADLIGEDTADVVALAGKVKRSLERLAREAERRSDEANGAASISRQQLEGRTVPDVVADPVTLQQAYRDAVRARTELAERITEADRLASAAQEATAELETIQDVTLDDAERAVTEIDLSLAELQKYRARVAESVEELKQKWQDEERRLSTVLGEIQIAEAERDGHVARLEEKQRTAEQVVARRQKLHQIIEAGKAVVMPSRADLNAAADAEDVARKAIEDASQHRRDRETADKAKESAEAALRHSKAADELRKAAAATDGVLSGLVERYSDRIKVRGGRLFVTGHKRGPEVLLAELSHGERWALVIDLVLNTVPSLSDVKPVITIPQEAWEGLDHTNQQLIREHAVMRGVVVLAGCCGDSERLEAMELLAGD